MASTIQLIQTEGSKKKVGEVLRQGGVKETFCITAAARGQRLEQ